MSCGIENGLTIACDDIRAIGGLKGRIWAVNLDDIASYTTDGNGYITAITFETYGGLYALNSRKQSHTAGYTAQIAGDGGNKFFQHDVGLKLYPNTPTEDAVLEDLLVGNFVFIAESFNQEFFLYGKENGLESSEGSQSSGQVAASDIGHNMTFVGLEKALPKRVLDTDYATTLALLESYEV